MMSRFVSVHVVRGIDVDVDVDVVVDADVDD